MRYRSLRSHVPIGGWATRAAGCSQTLFLLLSFRYRVYFCGVTNHWQVVTRTIHQYEYCRAFDVHCLSCDVLLLSAYLFDQFCVSRYLDVDRSATYFWHGWPRIWSCWDTQIGISDGAMDISNSLEARFKLHDRQPQPDVLMQYVSFDSV
jgi:hypothetical protein